VRELRKNKKLKIFNIMKNKFKIVAAVLTLGFIIGLSTISIPQPPPPPAGHGYTGDTAPGGGMAPVGSGLVLLLSMGAAYGAKKVFNARKRLEE
jgi:hypothetical protein